MIDNIILVRHDNAGKYEYIPELPNVTETLCLIIDSNNNIKWSKFPECPKLPELLHFNDNRLGIGREPLYNYIVDIGIPKNTVSTGLHIGDGECGFSLGNGTKDGFIPMIIGMGHDECDAGLYLLARSGNKEESDNPLIVLDARTRDDVPITNRPLLGIGSYSPGYYFIVNKNGNIHTTQSLIDKSTKPKTDKYNINLDNLKFLDCQLSDNKIYYRKSSIKKLDENIIKDDGIDIYQLIYGLLNIVQQQNEKINNLENTLKRIEK